jgi:hypothetical protein
MENGILVKNNFYNSCYFNNKINSLYFKYIFINIYFIFKIFKSIISLSFGLLGDQIKKLFNFFVINAFF